ncbi:MAG: hypothetical protein ACOH2J_07675 [Allorhizobium sp.]
MPATRAETYKNYSELLEGLGDSTAAIKAAAALVELAFRQEEQLAQEAHGIWLLFKQQCDNADFFCDALRNEIADIRASKLEVRNSDRIAEWAGVSQYVVNSVISIATGIELGPRVPPKKEVEDV